MRGMAGLEASHVTPNGTGFLVFDTVESATAASDLLKQDGHLPRYAQYRMFIKFTPPIRVAPDQAWDPIVEMVESAVATACPDANIMRTRLHVPPHAGGMVRNGLLVVDRLQDLQQLIHQSYGTFQLYRYRMTNRPGNENSGTGP